MTPYKSKDPLLEYTKTLNKKVQQAIISETLNEIIDKIIISQMIESQIFNYISSTLIANVVKANIPKRLVYTSESSGMIYVEKIIAEKISDSILFNYVCTTISTILKAILPQSNFKFICKAKSVPKKDDYEENEDSFFFNERAIGVADGVSGWSKYGISAKEFSNELINNCSMHINKLIGCIPEQVVLKLKYNSLSYSLFSNDKEEDEVNNNNSDSHNSHSLYIDLPDPTIIVEEAFQKINNCGSSTFVLAVLNKNNVKVSVLGDSKLVHVKFDESNQLNPYSENISTKSLMHKPDTPFQLTKIPTYDFIIQMKSRSSNNPVLIHNLDLLQNGIKRHSIEEDKVSSAEKYLFYVNEWDIIVAGSDGIFDLGLFDNLFIYEIIEIINKAYNQRGLCWTTKEEFAAKIVNEVSNEVHKVMHSSLDRRTIPFQEAFKAITGQRLMVI